MNAMERSVFHAIVDLTIVGKGTCPSISEIQSRVGSKSRGAVHSAVKALECDGHIRRLPSRSRAIEIVARRQWFVFDDATKALKPTAGKDAPR